MDILLMYVLLNVTYYSAVTLINHSHISRQGLTDLVRPIVYVVYFVFPLFFPLNKEEFVKLIRFLLLICAVQIAFSALIYLDFLWPVVNLYKGRTSATRLLFHFYRWSGTFVYPSDFAFFLSFFLYFLFLSMRHNLYDRRITFASLFLISGALVLTLSRGGLGTVVVMMVLATFMYGGMRGILYYALISIVSGLIYYVALNIFESYMFNVSYVQELFQKGLDAPSARHRIVELKFAWKTTLDNFPIGIGPDRGAIIEIVPVVETLYGHYLIKWGVLGLVLHFASVVYLSMLAYKLWKTDENKYITVFGGATFILILSVYLVFGFSNAIIDRFKGLSFYFTLMGYLVMLDNAKTR